MIYICVLINIPCIPRTKTSPMFEEGLDDSGNTRLNESIK